MSILSQLFCRLRGEPLPPFHPPAPPDGRAVSAFALRERFRDCGDFESRTLWPGGAKGPGLCLCWLDGLTDAEALSEEVVKPLTDARRLRGVREDAALFRLLAHGGVFACTVRAVHSLGEAEAELLHGSCALVFDRLGAALCFEVKSAAVRPVGQPTVEKSVKGAKEAFTETLRVNTALVRRRLRTPELHLRQTAVGRRSGTDLAILWVEGLADPAVLEELRRRLDAVDVDGVTAAGHLEQYLTDRPRSPFPQLLHTERPDCFAAELLSGRIGLLADGLPVGFLLPASLPSFLEVAEDRAQHFVTASLLRLLRWLGLGLSLLFPALFVAVAMYHQEMIPTRLLQSMIAAKQDVPFPVAAEVLAMLLSFELLMEAGVRLPDPVGDTVSIIGALIVGQSAVEAKVVSPIAVIVVAATAICGFLLPSRDLGAIVRLLRLVLVLLAMALGLVGVALGVGVLFWYLAGLESFGLPYLSPLSEGGLGAVLRAVLRVPLPEEKLRPAGLSRKDRRRQR